ncbi:MAG: tagatose-6-phosphate kinase [Chloroflexi bacterium]|nr:tagatose-6-phosphate kinase [Chloroflexota bacterium]
MIVTVTLNAALDRTLVAPDFTLGTSRSVEHGLNLGGGKGLNVARALHSLQCPVLALGFAGGLTGAQIQRSLEAEGLPHQLTTIRGESRTCTAIVDPARSLATEINEPGPPIESDEIAAFLASFDRAVRTARLVCLSGSLPAGMPADYYATLIAHAREAGVPCFLDSRGAALRAGIHAGPLLVKPNQHEAAELFGETLDPFDSAAVQRALPKPGPAGLAITLGADGAVLHSPGGSWRAYAPKVQPVDTVGAGDSFVAGLAAGLVRAADQQDLLDVIAQPDVARTMLRLATATAVANTLTIGAGRCDPADIARLLELVRVEPL